MLAKLTKSQRIQLFNALLAAFPSWDALDLMVRLQLAANLEAIASRSGNLQNVVLAVITWAEAGGYLGELTSGALSQQPDNPELQAFAAAMAATPATPTAADTSRIDPAPVSKEHYERLVWKAVQFAGTAAFREDMIARERSVCRVECPEGAGLGTGFLVGRNLMMTNYHVLADFIEGRQPPSAIRCRFDYQENAEGTTVSAGRVATLVEADWVVRASRIGDLDYALVRLSEAVGDDLMPGGVARGFLKPAAHAFAVGESVFIIQHPKAAPLKISAGGVAALAEQRVHYLANTLEGSSGSPCFTSEWTLAALHRGSDGISNIGIPFAAILPDLHKAPAITLR